MGAALQKRGAVSDGIPALEDVMVRGGMRAQPLARPNMLSTRSIARIRASAAPPSGDAVNSGSAPATDCPRVNGGTTADCPSPTTTVFEATLGADATDAAGNCGIRIRAARNGAASA